MKNEIFSFICQTLKNDCLKQGDFSLDTRLEDDLLMESIDMLTFVTLIENHFRIHLDVFDQMPKNLGDVVHLIERKMKEASSHA